MVNLIVTKLAEYVSSCQSRQLLLSQELGSIKGDPNLLLIIRETLTISKNGTLLEVSQNHQGKQSL